MIDPEPTPNTLLKARENAASELYPTCSQISAMGSLVFNIKSFPFNNRHSVMYCMGGIPTKSLSLFIKEIRDIPEFLANSFKFHSAFNS